MSTTVNKTAALGPTCMINVGTIGHIDRLSARRVAIAIQQLGVTAAVAAERLSKLYVPPKSQPFWTQQGRHKKGGRGRY